MTETTEPPLTDERIDAMTYGERLEQLEEVVRRLEAGTLSLDATVHLFENGVRLHKACMGELESAEGRLRELSLADAEAET